jgi:outer membrane protein TolC
MHTHHWRRPHYTLLSLLLLVLPSLLFAAIMPNTPVGQLSLPSPHDTRVELSQPALNDQPPQQLTMEEAIALAIRYNPNVKSSELQRVLDKYSVILAQNAFRPQYQLQIDQMMQRGMRGEYNINPTLHWQLPSGTQFSADPHHVSITQPLGRDFGEVNRIPYLNALNTEAQNQIIFQKSIMAVVLNVVKSYRSLVESANQLDIQTHALAQAKQDLIQRALELKHGRLSRSQYVEQEVNYQSQKLSLVEGQDSYQQSYFAFLLSLGLSPHQQMHINKTIAVKKVLLPAQSEAIARVLAHNPDYQARLLAYQNTERDLLIAQNARRWKLDLNLQQHFNDNRGIGSSGAGHPSVGLSLDIPIDDIQEQAAVVAATVAIDQAKLALNQARLTLESQTITELNRIKNTWSQIIVAERGITLKRQALADAKLKVKYGKGTIFEQAQRQDDLLDAETSLVSTKITYLNALTDFDDMMGKTLVVWHVEVTP